MNHSRTNNTTPHNTIQVKRRLSESFEVCNNVEDKIHFHVRIIGVERPHAKSNFQINFQSKILIPFLTFNMRKPSQTLYCNNLNDQIKKQELRRSLFHLFSQYGTVIDVVALKTPRMRGERRVFVGC